MAVGKKTGGRNFEKGNTLGQGRPKVPEDLKQSRSANRENFERILSVYTKKTASEINLALKSSELPILEMIVAKILAVAFNEGDPRRTEFILDRLIGTPREEPPLPTPTPTPEGKVSFEEFCLNASYPKPYPKQHEMRAFVIDTQEPHLLLGAREYGKTDYTTILGVAYDIYCNPGKRWLIITKSKERNAAMIDEIAKALIANGVALEKQNSTCVRVAGLVGKDHSVSAVTLKTVSLRGRHPDGTIMDDPVTEDDESEATRKLVKKKYSEIYKLCPNIAIIGQPVHKFDLYAELRPILKKMEVPWGSIPELDANLDLQLAAGISAESISASYHLKVISEGTTPFDNIKYVEKFPTGDRAVAWLDPAFKGTGKDTTALSIVKAHFDGVAVLGKVWKKAWNHCLEEMIPHLVACNVKIIMIECNSLGDQPVIMMRQLFKAHNLAIGVQGHDSVLNKHSKIMSAGAYAHLIHLSKESDRGYTSQVIHYEYGSEPDDAPDSLASCLQAIGLIKGKQKKT